MILNNLLKGLLLSTAVTMSLSAHALNLRMSNAHTANQPTSIALKEMAQHIHSKTNGEINITVFTDGVLGTEQENINQIRAGILDIVRTAPQDLEKFEPSYSALILPYLFDSQDQMARAMEKIKTQLFQSSKAQGFIGIAWSDAGSRSFYTNKHPIKTPQDLNGLKIRVPNSQSIIRTVTALGATATPLPFSENYTALQQGVVDGAENSPVALVDSKHGEVAKYFTLDRHLMIPDILIISTKTWNKLTPEQQTLFADEAEIYTKRVRELSDALVEKSMAEAKEKMNVQFFDVDIEPFREKTQPLYDEIKSNPKAYDLVQQIRSVG